MSSLKEIKDKKMSVSVMSDYCDTDLCFCKEKERVFNFSNKMNVDVKCVNNIVKNRDNEKTKEKAKLKEGKTVSSSLSAFYRNISALCDENVVSPVRRFIRGISSINSRKSAACNKLIKEENVSLETFKDVSSHSFSTFISVNENENKIKLDLESNSIFFETYDDFLEALTILKNYLNKKKDIKCTDFNMHTTVGTGSFGRVRLVTLKNIDNELLLEKQNLKDNSSYRTSRCNEKQNFYSAEKKSILNSLETSDFALNPEFVSQSDELTSKQDIDFSTEKNYVLSCACLSSKPSCSSSSFCHSYAKSQNTLTSLDKISCNICRNACFSDSVVLKNHTNNCLNHRKYNIALSRIPIALKILTKTEIVRLKQVEHVKDEKNILSTLQHPFIINLLTSFQDEEKLYMLMEYMNGGELFSYLRREGRLSNDHAMFYVSEIILAFQYMHSLDIVYRDLKPENLLLDSWGHIKITDFGFAKRVLRTARTYTLCGTPEYLAPEIIQSKGHSQSADWWTLGVLTFEMIAGYSPFYDVNPFAIYQKVLSGKIVFPKHFSSKAKDFVKRLLVIDRSKRFGCSENDAEDVKKHKWLKSINWEKCYRRELKPLYIPRVSCLHDTSVYDNYPESEIDEEEQFDDESLTMFADNASCESLHRDDIAKDNIFFVRESFSTRSSNKFFSFNDCEGCTKAKLTKQKTHYSHNSKDKLSSPVSMHRTVKDSKRKVMKYEYDVFADF